MVLFGEAGVPHEVARKHAKKFHKHGMKITFVPDLKNRLRDCLREVKAEQVVDAQSKKIESASFVKKYFQDLRAKEAEEKEQEEDQINEEHPAHSISIDSGNEGDNESVMDEAAAFAQFKKAMDFYLLAKKAEDKKRDQFLINSEGAAKPITIDLDNEGDDEAVVIEETVLFKKADMPVDFYLWDKKDEDRSKEQDRAIFVKKNLGEVRAKESEDNKTQQNQFDAQRTATQITIDLDSESDDNSVVIEEIDLPKRPAIRFHHNLWAKDAKEKKNQHNQINTDCKANLIIIGSDSESDDGIIEVETKFGPVGPTIKRL